jgi:hypothetical protein
MAYKTEEMIAMSRLKGIIYILLAETSRIHLKIRKNSKFQIEKKAKLL